MIKEINDEIRKVKEDLVLLEILEKKLIDSKEKLIYEEDTLEQLTISLEKENKDVEKLKKFTLTNIVATLLKSKEEKLDKELEEYLAAKSKYDAQNTKVQMIKETIQSIEHRMLDFKYSEKLYRKLLNEKLDIIKKLGDRYNVNIIDRLETEINKLIAEKIEITEAISAGDRVVAEITAAEKLLSSAESWGVWDMFGGGFIASMAKHDDIDKANIIMKRIPNLLKSFNNELGDINLDSLKFSGITVAFDIYFDNIFTDATVQNKITEARQNIKSLNKQVKGIIYDLQFKKIDVENNIKVKKDELDSVIVKII